MPSLAVLHRPQIFEDCIGQESIIRILKRQIELNEFKNCYLFAGPSGCGKTTIARIFSHEINAYKDDSGNWCSSEPIEIDGASNNGVDNVRNIIQNAKERSLDGKYKIFIIDEAHAITIQAWNAFLKCIEEPPKYTIFIFCTTDPQKIPNTILNRTMRFNFSRVSPNFICNRLIYICEKEGYTNYNESCDFISKIANGGVRDAIALLEKCVGYSNDLSIDNVVNALGTFNYQMFFDLTDAIIEKREDVIIKIIDKCFIEGRDLKTFITQYLEFVLDLNKYCIFHSLSMTKIPSSMIDNVNYTTGIEDKEKFKVLMKSVLDLLNIIKQDTIPQTTISITLLDLSRRL